MLVLLALQLLRRSGAYAFFEGPSLNLIPSTSDMFDLLDAQNAAAAFAEAEASSRGAIFTKREIVEFVLDLTGYVETASLSRFRLLEPAAGAGDFLLPAIERLVRSYLRHGGAVRQADTELRDAVRAFEVHRESLSKARNGVVQVLRANGVGRAGAQRLAAAWLIEGDFLTAELPRTFTHVVGNPPYVRQELIPAALLRIYRQIFRTLYDRADLYVLFYEKGLDVLAPGGRLGYICADRWTKNKYGGPLRKLIADDFHLTHFVDLTGSPAFHVEVDAYPAITVLERPVKRISTQATRVAYRPTVESKTLRQLARQMQAKRLATSSKVVELNDVVVGNEPWILHEPMRLMLIRRLERLFPLIEDAGCKVGIGVATGADEVYIQPYDQLDVEPSRKVPLAMARDIMSGDVHWKGMAVLNPFELDGKLVDLRKYPRFARYIEEHGAALKRRHVARRSEAGWYRTIDRIYPELAEQPKLLVPDIKGCAHFVFEDGYLYPHHNLYYITAVDWDLRALQVILMSGIARLFVGAYATVMRGGFLRFQAQYLRRIRVPRWSDVPARLKTALIKAAKSGDAVAGRDATCSLYGLSADERAQLHSD